MAWALASKGRWENNGMTPSAAASTDPRIAQVIRRHGARADALIEVLHQVQELHGYLAPESLRDVATGMRLPLSRVHGVASFYHLFRLEPPTAHRCAVCLGTACYVKGGQQILDLLKKEFGLEPEGITPDGKFSLEIVRCLGCCGLAPVLAIGDDIHRKVKPGQVKDILGMYQ